MELTIYADVLFATNFLMDLLILFLTVQLSRIPFNLARLTLATALLAFYGTVSFMPELSLITSFLGRAIVGAIGIWLLKPCGGWRGFRKAGAVFTLVSALVGGVVYFLAVGTGLGRELKAVALNDGVYFLLDMRLLLAGILLSYGLLFWYRSICIRNFSRDKILVPMTFSVGEHRITITALLDTGCELTAPVTGEGVLLVSEEVLEGITPQNSFWLTVHTAGGTTRIPAFYSDGVECLSKKYELQEQPLMGIVKGRLSKDGLYSGICNPQILRENNKNGGRNHEKEVEKVFAMLVANLTGVAWNSSQRGLLYRRKRNTAHSLEKRGGGKTSFATGHTKPAGTCQKDPYREKSSIGSLHSTKV